MACISDSNRPVAPVDPCREGDEDHGSTDEATGLTRQEAARRLAAGLGNRTASGTSRAEARTAAAIALFVVALWVLGMLARPASPVRAGLVLAMAAAFVLVMVVPSWRSFFAFDLPRPEVLAASVGLAVLAAVGLEAGWRLAGAIHHRPPPFDAAAAEEEAGGRAGEEDR